jgi:hypothetical protein
MVEDWEQDVLSHVPQDGPIDLLAAAFNVATATTDEELIMERINKAILRIAPKRVLTFLTSRKLLSKPSGSPSPIPKATTSTTRLPSSPPCSWPRFARWSITNIIPSTP